MTPPRAQGLDEACVGGEEDVGRGAVLDLLRRGCRWIRRRGPPWRRRPSRSIAATSLRANADRRPRKRCSGGAPGRVDSRSDVVARTATTGSPRLRASEHRSPRLYRGHRLQGRCWTLVSAQFTRNTSASSRTDERDRDVEVALACPQRHGGGERPRRPLMFPPTIMEAPISEITPPKPAITAASIGAAPAAAPPASSAPGRPRAEELHAKLRPARPARRPA